MNKSTQKEEKAQLQGVIWLPTGDENRKRETERAPVVVTFVFLSA